MKRSMAAVVIMVAVMAIGSAANAAPILDQVNNPTTGSISAGGGFVQQQVTAGMTGTLAGFDIMPLDGQALSNYSFFIASGPAWSTSTHLFDLTGYSHAAVTTGTWEFIDTSAANINFNVGDKFVIGWTSGEGRLASSGNTYAGGAFWSNSVRSMPSDLAFQTYVVPEPATMSLLALGGIATLIRRRRRA